MSITFRITSKLVERVKQPLVVNPSTSTGLLGDWYVNLLYVERHQIILAISEKTLLPILIPAKDTKLFPERLTESLKESLISLNISKHQIEIELAHMSTWVFAKTASRQLLGVMTDFGKALECYVDHGETLQQIQARLAQTPCSPIGMDSPAESTCKLFGVTTTRMGLSKGILS